MHLQNASLAQPNFTNARGNGTNQWKNITYADMAHAASQGLALQSAFSHINTDNPDLSGFKAAGGKVISYHGLADDLIMPQGSLNYFQRAATAMGGVDELQKFNRLYLIPGLGHDSSFSRSGTLDPATGAPLHANKLPLPQNASGRDELFSALRNWVENGAAPGSINVSSANGSVSMPLCLYPQKVSFVSGSPTQAASYRCQ